MNGLVCALCGVSNPDRAADLSLTNYATIQQTVGIGNRAALRLKLTGTAPATHRAGVVIGSSSGTSIDVSALQYMVVRTYLNGTLQEARIANAGAVVASALDGGRMQLSFLTTLPFDEVELEATIVLNVLNSLNVYYAFAVPAILVNSATGYLSRLTAPTSADYDVAVAGGALCLNSSVQNPLNAVTADMTDKATLHVTGVGCVTRLNVKLEGDAPGGYYAGFVLGSSSLLDVNALTSLQIRTYSCGTLQETGSAANLLGVNLLPDGKFRVGFKTLLPFDHVEIERTGVVGLLDDLDVYYGYGIEASAFEDITPVYSNFDAGQTAGNFQVGGSCSTASCISNPSYAADAPLGTNYAQFNYALLSLGATRSIRLRLNGVVYAGNRVGVALSINDGLLSTSLLQGVTLRTYDASNNLVETASGSNLVLTDLLSSNFQRVSFLTTQPFDWVEVEVANTLSVAGNAKIYYAFAEDPIKALPVNTIPGPPLPVGLRTFQANATKSAVLLNWQTIQEQNCKYFVIERATDPAGKFEKVALREGAGNSGTLRAYSADDAEVAALAAGTLYYRLRQVDTKGLTTYSAVQRVQWLPGGVSLKVYPNPATTATTLELNAMPGSTVRVYTSTGKLVKTMSVDGPVQQLRLADTANGLYHVVLFDAQGQRVASEQLSVTH